MRGMMRAIRLLGRPCRDFAEVISESMEHELTFWERMAVRFHTLYCGPCRRYRRHIQAIRQMIARWLHEAEQTGPASGPILPADMREQIGRAIREAR